MTSSNGLVAQVEKLVTAELEKRRKGMPDSGMDVTAWNAANPQHPKDARGRWSDNPAGRVIAQAYSNLRAAPGRDPGAEWVSLASLREEVGADLSRADLDDELKRLDRASVINLVPENNQKTLTEAQRAAGLRMGGQDKHLVSFMGGELPAPGNVMGRSRERHVALSDLEDMANEFPDWDEDALRDAQRAATEFARKAEQELMRRKGEVLNPPKKPRATARLTNKPPKDLAGVADRMRAATTRQAAERELDGLTVADLRAVAVEANVPLASKMTKQQIKDNLIKGTGGERTSRALFPSMESPTSDVVETMDKKPATARLTSKPTSDPIAKQEAKISALQARLGLAEEKRRRQRGGRIATLQESKLRAQISEAKRELSRLKENPAPLVSGGQADVARRLSREGITRAEVEAELEGLKVAELKALAKTLRQQGMPVTTAGTRKDDIKADILEGLVGFRERARAIFEGSTGGSYADRFSVVQGGKA